MRSLKFDFEMRRHISILKRGYIVYGYFTEANCKYLNKIFVCCFYHITIATMSDNREPEIMLYFTDEVFRHLANQNRGHIHVMLEYRIK